MKHTRENILFVEKPKQSQFKDITDQQFGRLTVLGYAGTNKHRAALWWCECACIDKTIKQVTSNCLRNGSSKSCGCLNQEKFRERVTTHGQSAKGKISPEFGSYMRAKQRCENPNHPRYKDWGGRGIKVLFNTFEEFLAEVGEKPEPKDEYSIDRIDNNRHYEIGNIKWSNRNEQQRNKTNNRLITSNGMTKTLIEWSEYLNISVDRLDRRLYTYKWCDQCVIELDKNKRCIHKEDK
jgi:hypothetical protein